MNNTIFKKEFAQPIIYRPVDDSCVLWITGRGSRKGSGTFLEDLSKKGNNGTINGAIWKTIESGMNALQFDGVDDYVDCGSGASLTSGITSALTAEAWVYPHGTSNWMDAAAQYGGGSNGWILRTSDSSNGHFTPHVYIGGLWYNCDAGAVPINQWSHILLTYDGEMLKSYLNGKFACQNTDPSGNLAMTGPTVIGGKVAGEYFAGLIGEVRIYNRVLSVEEIQQYYQNTKHLYGYSS